MSLYCMKAAQTGETAHDLNPADFWFVHNPGSSSRTVTTGKVLMASALGL